MGGLPCSEGALKDWFRGREDIGAVFERSRAFARPLPVLPALGVCERVLDRAMEAVIETVVQKTYKPEFLREQLLVAAAEVDYILSLYA